VNDLLAQVPDTLRKGYSAGMGTNTLSTEYGYQSPEFQTFIGTGAANQFNRDKWPS
jgi:hypothetical protein